MADRFNPFPRVSGRYGAPMGRAGAALDPRLPLDRLCVSHPQGEYDSGGAYWGLGGASGSLFAVWERGNGCNGVAYVRASGPLSAKLQALHGDEIEWERLPDHTARARIGNITATGDTPAAAMTAAHAAYLESDR